MSTFSSSLTTSRRGEPATAFLAAVQFFLILTCLMALRPARESLGLESGIETIRWLFMGTLVVTLAVHPLFAWLVSRTSRRVFVPVTFRFFALSLIGFWVWVELWPETVGTVSGRVFYVWFSVFNLAVVSLFWSMLADGFRLEQSKRLFGVIAVGGTAGAVSGSAISGVLAEMIGTPALLLIGALLLEISVWVAAILSRRFDQLRNSEIDHKPKSRAIIGGSMWSGMMHVMRSPYLMAICTYILLGAVALTFLYFTQLNLVDALGGTRDQNTRLFANIELWTQIATLLLQAFVAGFLMKRLGVGLALALLPLVTAAGLVWLAVVPALGAFVLVQAMFRAVQRAIARPARETLFTVVSREDKYKAKSLIDTFVHRGGDVVGAQLQQAIAPGLLAVSAAMIPMAAIWAALSFYLGFRQRHLAMAAETRLPHIDTTSTEPA